MKSATVKEMKKRIKTILFFTYGFEPPAKDIIMLEAHGDMSMMYFKINDIEYEIRNGEVEKL